MQWSSRHQGMMLLILATVLFSSKGIFVKFAYHYAVAPMELLMIRMLIALPVYALVLWVAWPRQGESLTVRTFFTTALFGISGYYIASYFDLFGLLYLPASLERLVLFTYPGMVIVLASVFLGQKLYSRLLLWLLITYAGLCLAFVEDVARYDLQAKEQLQGAVMVFIAAIAFAVYMIGNEVMQRQISSALFTSLAMLAATAVIIVHFALHYDWHTLWQQPLPVYGWTAMIAMFSTVLPSFMLASGIRRLGAATGSVIGSAGPVLTLLMAYAWLGEQLSVLQMAGFMLVILGVYQLGRRA